ncbi:N-acetylglucosaminyldiphosphoundecaprenol N-acetyl-beta-D-mannosaminyltransferase TarA [Staphylococcus simiae]|uniref:N-acetylglucosaminyldiphosphoundecaprenol N-acetyl-beta-D-mannosaminyltransferase n=1 Tax=Staphylococcus simiae CCM 7213 = CCUG 51256 TaxID=911238 RepID=G5JM63_9STAP|nr:N-acetylglucosaminyldiphosphoundecaprenol N-acetyl-beta-D-mannosaminyltransferase TarA [Staphylococcus simiae]EHJ06710.1 teichoic acid biosynthesis protein [Staphylococcus simiae CCM 7213 = CCUG 51256]PNZ09211.1 glycosyltransferase [Staphylococcus simiae]SNV63181.1 N-acetylmannosaminyltransferase [Staphylococcus simiae]
MTIEEKPDAVKVDILGVHFDNTSMLQMVENIKAFFAQQTPNNLFIVTANPEIVDFATTHQTYRKLINGASYVVADGTGVVKASERLNNPLDSRIPGIELMEECMKIAHVNHQKVFLLGATNEIVERAQQSLQLRYPNITFNHHHGYIDLEDETVIKRIKMFNPDYIFVGMGFPKQEQWIMKQEHHFQQTVLMGVGGSLEVFSGAKKRAPLLFRKLNIEWFYRAIIDWKRIGRLKSIPKFMFKVAKAKRQLKS